jgi:hypothetical protein
MIGRVASIDHARAWLHATPGFNCNIFLKDSAILLENVRIAGRGEILISKTRKAWDGSLAW